MKKFLRVIILNILVLVPALSWSAQTGTPTVDSVPLPTLTPTSPRIDAKGYVLIDANSGKVLASQNSDQRMPPASLTKMMTSYIISKALREGRIHLDDAVRISEKAWRTGGSKMFVKVGTTVPVRDLMQGIIVDSGNDACVAMAEHVAGTEESFVSLMNQQAALLGMKNTHYMDSTGMPNPQHYTTPQDIAILARALAQDFPEDYKWYSQKWFTYNGIKQPNRNRLLWRDPTVDGIKTGHTDEAGFCLVASGLRNGTRLISVVMGAPTDATRAEGSQSLLNYGFRFFETRKLYAAGTVLSQSRIWMGKQKNIPVGVSSDFYVTIPTGQYAHLKASMDAPPQLKAPVSSGQALGEINVTLNGEKIASAPLVALQSDPVGGLWVRMNDGIALAIHHFFGRSANG